MRSNPRGVQFFTTCQCKYFKLLLLLSLLPDAVAKAAVF
jgi:hypothetical protein